MDEELKSLMKYLEHQCGAAWIKYWMEYKWTLVQMTQSQGDY